MSDDFLNFHEVINHMQELEEEIIEDYKSSSVVSVLLCFPLLCV